MSSQLDISLFWDRGAEDLMTCIIAEHYYPYFQKNFATNHFHSMNVPDSLSRNRNVGRTVAAAITLPLQCFN